MTKAIESETKTLLKSPLLTKVNREKAEKFLTKLSENIIKNPDEEKFRSIKIAAIEKRFNSWHILSEGLNVFKACGFEKKDGQFVLNKNDIDNLDYLIKVIKFQSEHRNSILRKQRLAVIEQNANRLNTKEHQKEQELKKRLLLNHEEQMKDAAKGIFHVGKSVSDRKGQPMKGNQSNRNF